MAVLREENGIDLLFTDIVMPSDMDGVELTRRARNLRPGLKVLLSSGHDGDEIKSDLLRGRFSFISKPMGRRPSQPSSKRCSPRCEPRLAIPPESIGLLVNPEEAT